MGWGWGGGYRRRYQAPVGKKEAARSLSTSTLQRILEQQKEQERLEVQRHQQFLQTMQERAAKEAKERALEEQHGGKEALAKWRQENAAKIEKERQEAAERARAAAAEKAAVDALAELQAELAKLPDGHSSMSISDLNLNKGTIKTHFALTDKDLDALPKNVVMKEGAKKASSITWNGKDIVAASIAKHGKRQMRAQLALNCARTHL